MCGRGTTRPPRRRRPTIPVTSSAMPARGRSMTRSSCDSGSTPHSRPRALTSVPMAKRLMTPAFRTGRDGRRSWLSNRPAHRSAHRPDAEQGDSHEWPRSPAWVRPRISPAAGDDRRPSRIGRVGREVYGRSVLVPTPRSAHDRVRCRVSRAAAAAPARRPRAVTALRAPPPREDAAPQNRLREPRELAPLAGSRRAARAGLRRRGTPRLSRVRHPLLRIRPCPVHRLRPGVRGGVLLQGPGRLPILQRPPHGPDRRA